MVLEKNDSLTLNTITGLLKGGAVGIIPCDTIYGIVGRCPETEEKIREIKGRESGKQFIMLLGNKEEVFNYSLTSIPQSILNLWPGPLTLVLQGKGNNTIALRVPDDPFLSILLKKLNFPVFSTSVNRTGEPPLGKIGEIIERFRSRVDFIVDGGDLPEGIPSTVYDLSGKTPRILRQGICKIPEY